MSEPSETSAQYPGQAASVTSASAVVATERSTADDIGDPASESEYPVSPTRAARARVLVVDDELVIRDILSDFLSMEGFDVDTAEDGLVALDRLSRKRFDLVLSDLKMPNLDGLGLLDRISQAQIRVVTVIMTGFGTVETAINAMKHGAYDYILKPFKVEEVVHTIRRGLEKGRLEVENLRLKEAVSLYKVSEEIASALDIEEVLTNVTDVAIDECEADRAVILLQGTDGEYFARADQLRMGLDDGQVLGDIDAHALIQHDESGGASVISGRSCKRFFKSNPKARKPLWVLTTSLKVAGESMGYLVAIAYSEGTHFNEGQRKLLSIVANRAAAAIENARLFGSLSKRVEENKQLLMEKEELLEGQRNLLESFIRTIAAAIDAKSPHTSAHCERVPVLTDMITRAVCETEEGPFEDFGLTEDEWYELRMAAWMHDCGKVTTPVHVMDKATKLETIHDRIESVRIRIEVLKRDARVDYLEQCLALKGSEEQDARVEEARLRYEDTLAKLRDDLAFLERINHGGEAMPLEERQRVDQLAGRVYVVAGETRPLLTEDEAECLRLERGTLTERERLIINHHMVETIKMLKGLPFPAPLKRVPEYAGGHHEKMDGTGYPRGIYAGDMSVPARIMAIADVFEALTAQDRPYKRGLRLSDAMAIMGRMKRHNHLDPDLFDIFVSSGVYRQYGELFLSDDLIDEVDEASLLAIQAEAFELPPEEQRKERWVGFLPPYERPWTEDED